MKTPRKMQRITLTVMAQAIRGIICHPTGAGKTDTEIWSILTEIENAQYGFSVSAIFGPKIVLMTQHMKSAGEAMLTAIGSKVKAIKLHAIHCGKTGKYSDDFDDRCIDYDLPALNVSASTSIESIVEVIRHAKDNDYPVVFFSTYHSADRLISALLQLKIIGNIANCDEAHWMGGEDSNGQFSDLPGKLMEVFAKQFYFTATPVMTDSKLGTGMTNDKFGGLLTEAFYSPAAAIIDGYILRPRVHIVEVAGDVPKKREGVDLDAAHKMDATALLEAYEQHDHLLGGKIGSKLLVATRGSKHLKAITHDKKVGQYCKVRPNLWMFEILSGHLRITRGGVEQLDNGKEYVREPFMAKMYEVCSNTMNRVIILHYDILTEGIDMTGITGVMLFRSLNKTKLIQLLGRAARIYRSNDGTIDDDSRITREGQVGELSTTDFDAALWLKPYAWLIIPVYGEIGEDMGALTYSMIQELRRYDFDPYRHIYIKQSGSPKPPKALDQVGGSETKAKAKKVEAYVGELIGKIEAQETADNIGELVAKLEDTQHYNNFFVFD